MSRWQFLLCKRSARSTPKCLPNKVLGENVQRSEKISNMPCATCAQLNIYHIHTYVYLWQVHVLHVLPAANANGNS